MKRLLSFFRNLIFGESSPSVSTVVVDLPNGRLVITRSADDAKFFISGGAGSGAVYRLSTRLGDIIYMERRGISGTDKPTPIDIEIMRGTGVTCGPWSPCEGGYQRRICSRPNGVTWEEFRQCGPGGSPEVD